MRIIIPSLHSIPTLSLLPKFPSRHLRSSRIWGRSATVVSRSDPLLGGFAPYDCLPSPLLPGWVTHRRRHRLLVTAIPDPGASFFNTAALSLVPARSSCLPMGSRCKLLHLPPTTIQPHLQVVGALFWPWLHRLASTDAMRGLRLGVCVYDASAFPPPATPSTPSPWTPSLVPLGFQAFCVIWSSLEDFSVIWLLW
jgi:hypothetical protein